MAFSFIVHNNIIYLPHNPYYIKSALTSYHQFDWYRCCFERSGCLVGGIVEKKQLSSCSKCRAARSDGVSDQDYASSASSSPSTTGSSSRSQLELLEQLTSTDSGYQSEGSAFTAPTIREQLLQLVEGREGEFTIPLGKKRLKEFSKKFLTTSQRRNIKRQAMLNKVSERNDSMFFASIGLSVLVPPFLILAIAILTGYVKIMP